MKKTVIKSLSVLICVLMMSPVLSGFFAFAADDAFTSGSFTYTVDENGNATITKLDSGVTGSIIIPQRIGGYPVVAIGESSFKNCILVTQITIPASVKSISASFTNLSALEKCYYTGTLVQWFSIGFADAKCNPFSVTNEVYIDNNIIRGINASDIAGITELGKYSFANCANLEYVMFPASLQTIGNGCFYNCDNLISGSFPYGLNTISSQAFSDCDGIKEIHIPASVSSISLDSFSSCKNLEHISVDEGNSVFKSSGNCLIKGNTLLLGCKSSIIPENMGIETINSYAFRGCEGLERIDIPEGVVTIIVTAFDAFHIVNGVKKYGVKDIYPIISIGLGTVFYIRNIVRAVRISKSKNRYLIKLRNDKIADYMFTTLF
ncbi:MAG: leucine-rich repeat domain-containing protein [Clostridia bacterium]|nr:leucine-rich repeat domain-containing protein [Clostridia bacterium]